MAAALNEFKTSSWKFQLIKKLFQKSGNLTDFKDDPFHRN